jgi:hypothetical protein
LPPGPSITIPCAKLTEKNGAIMPAQKPTTTVFLSAASADLEIWRGCIHQALETAGCHVLTQNESFRQLIARLRARWPERCPLYPQGAGD